MAKRSVRARQRAGVFAGAAGGGIDIVGFRDQGHPLNYGSIIDIYRQR